MVCFDACGLTGTNGGGEGEAGSSRLGEAGPCCPDLGYSLVVVASSFRPAALRSASIRALTSASDRLLRPGKRLANKVVLNCGGGKSGHAQRTRGVGRGHHATACSQHVRPAPSSSLVEHWHMDADTLWPHRCHLVVRHSSGRRVHPGLVAVATAAGRVLPGGAAVGECVGG